MPRHVLLTVLVAVAATGCCSGGTAVLHPGLDVGGTRRALVGFCVNGASGGPGGLVGRRGVAAGLAVCQWSGRFALGERQQGAGGRGRIRAGAAWRAASKDEKSEVDPRPRELTSGVPHCLRLSPTPYFLLPAVVNRADSPRSQRGREAALQAERAKQLPKIFDVRFDGCSPRATFDQSRSAAFDQSRSALPQEPLCVEGLCEVVLEARF